MKRFLLTLAASVFALGLSAQNPTGVVGTMHDLSTSGANGGVTTYTQVCKFCHSPHGAQVGSAQLIPLWGHTTTAATYTMYGSNNPNSELQLTVDASPSGPSLACLSCHDGTVAVNSRYDVVRPNYGSMNAASTAAADFTTTTVGTVVYGTLNTHVVGAQAVGSSNVDLSNVHPISVLYDPAVDTGLKSNPVGVKLFNNKVQCASCHDVHNWKGAAGTSNGLFLRLTTTGSALCLACHNK